MKQWMDRLRTRVRDGGADRGAILIMAIAVVTIVALVTGAVLTRGDGSLRATVALRDAARSSYAADAAAQVAINDLRTGYNAGTGTVLGVPYYYRNAVGTGCFGYNGTNATSTTAVNELTLNNIIPSAGDETQEAMSAVVTCEAENATGEQGSAVPINNANKPGNAILTLSTSGAERGFTFKSNGSGAAFRVKGGIWSNSDIYRDNNGVLESTESIRAVSGCTPPAAMSAPLVNCSAGSAPDPNYQSDLEIAGSGIPALASPPASCPNNGSITLSPGYYDDVRKLNALTDTNQDCFIHMQPGTYYFDFHNDSGVSDPLFDADIATNAGNVWRIGSRKTIVAGTLTGDTTIPGRCVNPIDDVNAQGVQFIFGGTSRMNFTATGQDSAFEICGTYHSSRPPIAVYGQKTGTNPTLTTMNGANALVPTSVPAAGNFTGATAAAVSDVGGAEAVWTKSGNGNANSTMTVDGFAPATAIPKGAILTAATLQVKHKEGATNATASTIALTAKDSGGTTPLANNYSLPVRGTASTLDSVNLASNNANWIALKRAVHDKGFTGASVDFRAFLNADGTTASLDSVRLELSYYIPQLRQQTGSVATPAGERVIYVSGNSATFYIQGTTYVPLSSIYLDMNNLQESVFRFGVIARALAVFQTGSFAFGGAVIELPDNSPGFGFETTLVRLRVYLCAGVSSGCTVAGGKLALESRVKLFDPSANAANRQVEILNWSHTR